MKPKIFQGTVTAEGIEITSLAIEKGDTGVKSCPIAISLQDELPEHFKIEVNRDFIDVWDGCVSTFTNSDFVHEWIDRFDTWFDSEQTDDDLPPPEFRIKLESIKDEDGKTLRMAKGKYPRDENWS
ncbi:MAG: hypothetical protein CMO20_05450 [Thermoplasmata archaeon]|nr:hypothetical protein [Thermoplasmata archaeon]